MPTVNVYDLQGQVVGELQLSDTVFAAPVNEALLHQAVVAFQANQRAGTADTKTRSEVRGGGRKPWRQKGTGRARAGTTRAPHWRHGGVVFGPHPRDFSVKFPRKMRRAALRQALSAKLASNELKVVNALTLPEVKTKHVLAALDNLNLGRNVLFVTASPNETWKLSARNFKNVHTITTDNLNAYSLLRYHQIVLDTDAVARVEEVFAR
ncbi:50S ribosomal protein L4 [Sulfobacillus thermosulfidooxidans]|uniref:50S ribosomal protein L4 n=1 Tax=Sulfobacillus thermosulfidooxidans TaxID=28034 RepID=UPI0006B44EFB|nr:50S ribosomal protein L4 [Sulfobacillus thermosulfidooxidans]